MTSRKSNELPQVAIEVSLDERLLDFAFSDGGNGDPERLLIELEEAGDLTLTVVDMPNGIKHIQITLNED